MNGDGTCALIPATYRRSARNVRRHEAVSSRTPETIFASGLPPPGTPVAFADGVTNLAHSKYIVKFYLYRTDPDVGGSGPAQNNIVGQIVMPIDGFVRMAVFLNRGVDLLVSNEVISKLDVDNLKFEQGG